ncbi:peptidoglycan-binding protein [Kitasatospora sp. NPDC093806]|uniref:peptidoglycan-binding protein n=1 Tax=Kitasatospora sp. NPDC093806 TaxID=3155075 RepID=UPI003437E82F
MADTWMPGAIRADLGDHAPYDPGFPAKAIAHITADTDKATAAHPIDLVPFANLKSFFTADGREKAPHILWDPFTGAFAQFFPADSRSKAVKDLDGGTRTNRAGKVVIQVEALFFPFCRLDGKVFAKLTDTPCKGWDKLHAWIRSWGVPDTWPMGRPTDFTPHRSESVWETEGGWYAHAHVPENDHVDPGSWPPFGSRRGTD